jgi:hypothetical protein
MERRWILRGAELQRHQKRKLTAGLARGVMRDLCVELSGVEEEIEAIGATTEPKFQKGIF